MFALISILTGHFKSFTFLTLLILIHEIGHILAGLICKWKIKRVIILPFGCMTEFNELLNKPIYQEFFILIMGPIFQIIFSYFYSNPYHIPLLLFNLLPMYPLDGSKLIFLLWNKIGSYYNSYKVLFMISYLTIFIFLIYNRNLLFLLFGLYFLWESFSMIKKLYTLFYTFLYERYKYNFNFKKIKKIHIYKDMKRGYGHFFIKETRLISEKDKLNELFK
jgi:Peptidase family M50.